MPCSLGDVVVQAARLYVQASRLHHNAKVCHYSVPGSAWDRTAVEALPLLPEGNWNHPQAGPAGRACKAVRSQAEPGTEENGALTMNDHIKNTESVQLHSRRTFLQQSGMGLGSLALASLLHETSHSQEPSLARQPHITPKVPSAIWLFMTGGVSHVDTFDYKPELQRRHGQTLAGADPRTGFFETSGRCLRSPFRFRQHGRSGTWVSDLFPHVAGHVDDLAFVHSCYSSQNNHAPSCLEMMTGMNRPGYPSLGSWLSYGLGTLNQNLPSFVVMYETKPRGDDSIWSPGFLPRNHQALTLDARRREEIANLTRTQEVSDAQQRSQLDLLRQFNQEHQEQRPLEADLAARMQSFELAYRMQSAAPEAMDFNQEPQRVQEMYGLNGRQTATFGRQCLLARRLVERDVRFVQVFFSTPVYTGPGTGMCRGMPTRTFKSTIAIVPRAWISRSAPCLPISKYARPARIDASHLGRRIRPHLRFARETGGAITTRTPTRSGWPAAASAAASITVPPTISATRLWIIASASMTLTQRFCTCSDSTTRGLTYRYNGRNFRLTDVSGDVIREILT